MFASFLIRLLFVIGFTLLPILLANIWFTEELVGDWYADSDTVQRYNPTRYGLLTVVGSLTLAWTLWIVS